EEGVPALDDAHVMEGRVPARLERARDRQRAVEVLERGPRVAVVRPEAREVDVTQVEDVVGLDVEERVSARVPGRVHDANVHAAELEDVAVAEDRRIGTWREVELFDDGRPPRSTDRAVEAVDRHESIEGADAGCVGLVEMP